MPLPTSAEVRFADGTTAILSGPTVLTQWANLPDTGIVRVNYEPPVTGARGGFSLVLSGADQYWAYQQDTNVYVFGLHRPAILGGDGSVEIAASYYEFLFDRRARPRTEHEATGIDSRAVVKVGVP